MIKKLHTYIISSYLGPFVMTFFIAMFILLMQFLWKYIDDLVGKGLEWHIIAQLLFYASSTFVPLALPLAVLLSSLMTFGNLGEKYELVSMKSAGISLRQIMKPLLIGSVLLSIAAFYFSNNILPIANLKMRSLLYDVREQKPAVNIKEGVFYNGIENYVIRVGSKDKDGKTIRNIMIYDHTDRSASLNLTIAESGRMEFTPDKRYLQFYLYNGINYYEDISSRRKEMTHPLQRTTFKEQYVRLDLSEFALTRSSEELFKSNYSMLNLQQLKTVTDSLQRYLNQTEGNFNNKFTRYNLTAYNNFFNRKFTLNDSIKESLQDSIPAKPVGSDILNNIPKDKRTSVLQVAIDLSRSAKESIFFHSEDVKARKKLINKHNIEYFRKFTLSFACFLFFLIGAPLGAIIRRGGFGLPVVVSVLFFFIYHVISIIGEKSARESVLPPFAGMWLSTFVILPLGALLAYKATTDSPLLDADIWNRFFRKFNINLKRNKENQEINSNNN